MYFEEKKKTLFRVKVQEVTVRLGEVYMDLLELKQKKFERTAGNLNPRLLQKMVKFSMVVINRS